MQELPLREKIHFSLKVLASVRVHDSYEDIVKLIEKHRQEVLDKNHKYTQRSLATSEILCLLNTFVFTSYSWEKMSQTTFH